MQRQPPRIPYIQSNPTNLLQCPIHSNYNLQITGIIMDETKRKGYLREIKADYRYFESSYKRADFQIDIEHIKLQDIPEMIVGELQTHKVLPSSQIFQE